MTIPDPITTARRPTIEMSEELYEFYPAMSAQNHAEEVRKYVAQVVAPLLTELEKLKAALEVTQDEGLTEIARLEADAEKLKAERDEVTDGLSLEQEIVSNLEAKITHLTSQLEQAEKVIAPFADAAKAFAPVISDSDWCPIDFVCGKDMAEITVQVLSFRAASQWIKDRQAKGEG